MFSGGPEEEGGCAGMRAASAYPCVSRQHHTGDRMSLSESVSTTDRRRLI